jgi:protein gp37
MEPLKWNQRAFKFGEKHKVFSGSMCDVFDEEGPEGARNALLGMIINTPLNLIWILCTKRPQNIPGMVPSYWMQNGFPENVWLLVTAENQKRADERIPLILQLPVSVRGVSIEPMLGPIDLSGFRELKEVPTPDGFGYIRSLSLDWVIVGGESGPKARPMNPNWVRSVKDQCRKAGVPLFMKQIHINGKLSKEMKDWPTDLRIREFPCAI